MPNFTQGGHVKRRGIFAGVGHLRSTQCASLIAFLIRPNDIYADWRRKAPSRPSLASHPFSLDSGLLKSWLLT
jgi:hypothetical protein